MAKSIKTDLRVGLTFAGIALQARHKEKRRRNQNNARIAYDTMMRYCESSHASDEDRAEFESLQAELRDALQKLGEPV